MPNVLDPDQPDVFYHGRGDFHVVIRLVYKKWFMPRADYLQGVKTVVCYLIDWIKPWGGHLLWLC